MHDPGNVMHRRVTGQEWRQWTLILEAVPTDIPVDDTSRIQGYSQSGHRHGSSLTYGSLAWCTVASLGCTVHRTSSEATVYQATERAEGLRCSRPYICIRLILRARSRSHALQARIIRARQRRAPVKCPPPGSAGRSGRFQGVPCAAHA